MPNHGTTLTSAIILATFLFYFVFCFVAHLFTSRVERVPLPEVSRLKSWALAPDIVDVIISRPGETLDSNENFCNRLRMKLRETQGDSAYVRCIFREINSVDDNLKLADAALRNLASETAISWFFLSNLGDKHLVALGQYNHAWSIQGQLDDESWIEESLDVFSRTIASTSVISPEHIQSQKDYLLSFSVLVEDPTEVTNSWNFKQVVNNYLSPFLRKIRPIFHTRVDSQIIYYADIADHVQTKSDGSSFLKQTQLEDFMGRTKWNVESIHTPSFPALHFFIYIPLSAHSPLSIDSQGQSSTAFCIPRWGGLTIANSLARRDSTGDDFSSVMPVVLAQIRMMLGFPDPLWSYPGLTTAHQVVSDVGVADWELRLIQKSRLEYNYHNGYEKIDALIRLLDENLQLPVQDHVGHLIEQAVSNLGQCLLRVQEGLFDSAYDLCLDGYSAAHSAFFDETMLPLLYFPDEHIYAVYAPYFLSIFSVTISRTVQFVKCLRSWR